MSLNILLINCYIIDLLFLGSPRIFFACSNFNFLFADELAPAIVQIWSQSRHVAWDSQETSHCGSLRLLFNFYKQQLATMRLFLLFSDFSDDAQLWHICTILCRFNCCAGAWKMLRSFCGKYPQWQEKWQFLRLYNIQYISDFYPLEKIGICAHCTKNAFFRC